MESRTPSSISQPICIAKPKLQSDEFNEQILRKFSDENVRLEKVSNISDDLFNPLVQQLQHDATFEFKFCGLKETDQPPSSLAFPGKRITDIRDGEIIPVTCTLPNFTQTLLPLIISASLTSKWPRNGLGYTTCLCRYLGPLLCG